VNDIGELSAVKLALLAQQLRTQTDDAGVLAAEPIAIIGLGCRFPGGVDTPAAFWDLLHHGGDAVTVVPPDRWDADAFYDPDPYHPGTINTRRGAFVDGIDQFDADYFGISPREAARMDPQQRLLMEVAVEALERAGQPASRLAGSLTGVFVAATMSDYSDRQLAAVDEIDAYSVTGNVHCILANRLSFALDLRGPSVAVDTACSSSLVAVHLACQSLRARESDMALVGGVNVVLAPEPTIAIAKWGVLAPDGNCKTFAADADGFVRGEGCGVVVLERLADAIAAGDPVAAVIRGSAVNQDGRSAALSAPSGRAQQDVIRRALHTGRVRPDQISCVEAHGTGTALGDPIEVEALAAVVGAAAPGAPPVALTAVKPNIGHLEAAAGIAGVIKIVLCLQHHEVPAAAHLAALNPHLRLGGTRLFIPTEPHPWPSGGPPRVAGVSSFGFGGTNAHVVVEEAPPRPAPPARGGPFALPVSGRTPAALREAAGRLAEHLGGAGGEDIADACFTAAVRRTHHDERLVVVGANRDELAEGLRRLANREPAGAAATGRRPMGTRRRLAFVCSGQGPQWWAMGRQLLADNEVFRDAVEACDKALRAHADWSLVDELTADEATSRLDLTEYAQPAIFALQVGLAAVWRSWGVAPDAVVGHSVGEVAAAHLAGALTLDDAIRVVALRGRLMGDAAGRGTMAALELPATGVEAVLIAFGDRLAVAAVNGPAATVISGDADAMAAALDTFRERGAPSKPLPVNYAFHSAQMESAARQLAADLADLAPGRPHVALVSTVTGGPIADRRLDGAYWADNVRQTVRFAAAVRTLAASGCDVFVELAPHPVLGGAIAETLAGGDPDAIVVASLRRGRPDLETMLAAVGALHCGGVAVDWEAVMGGRRRVVDLPTYAWQHRRHWCDTRPRRRVPSSASSPHPFVGRRLRSPAIDGYVFESELTPDEPAFLNDHRVGDLVVVPATAFLEWAAAAFAEATSAPAGAIADVELHSPLVLRPDQPVTVQIHLRGVEPMAFTVSSAGGDDWTVHATGRVSSHVAPDLAVELASVRSGLGSATEADALYAGLAAKGVPFGESFRAVTELAAAPGRALARVVAPLAVRRDAGRYRFHPALLDACLHALDALLAPGAGPSLPVALAELRLHREEVPAELWAHVQVVVSAGPATRADVAIFDVAGAPVASIAGLRLVRTTPEALARAAGWAGGNDDVLYRVTWEAADPVGAHPNAGPWLIISDRAERGELLAARLSTAGATVALVAAADSVDIGALLASSGARHVVDLRPLDAPPLTAGADATAAVLPVVNVALATVRTTLAAGAPRLWFVTRGAQAVDGPPTAPEQAPVWGVAASVAAEHPALACTCIDLDPAEPDPVAIAALAGALAAADAETRVGLRGNQRFAARLAPIRSHESADATPTRLVSTEPGVLEALELVPFTRRPPGPGEIEIRVHVSGLNFRDVLLALDLYPEPASVLGDECSGEVVRVGPGVDHFRPGDRVMAMAPAALADYTTTAAALAIGIPDTMTFEDAATLPIAFLTAQLALVTLAGLAAGDRVLIHAAAGGVGMAAVQLAQRAGAEVFATAGTPEKRAALSALGVRHVFDSRSLAFADEVRQATGEKGVDVVLNSLAGEFIPRSLDVVAPGGRFLELGRRDVWTPQQVAAVRPDVAYHIVFLGDLVTADRPAIASMLADLVPAAVAGALRPLPWRAFAVERAVDAFRHMAQARHIGKVLVRHDNGGRGLTAPNGTFLVTGGTGGVGVHLARRLADRGVRHLALVGRGRADVTPVELERLRELGVHVVTFEADVADREAMRRVLTAVHETMPPLRGVIHAAGVTDDAVAAALTDEQVARVLRPKVHGGWHLHDLTRDLPLDVFVLVSSAASVVGSPGQANYAAANAFLDALGEQRRAETGVGLAIGWGPWDDVGMTARLTSEQRARMARRGVRSLAPERALDALERALSADGGHVLAMDVDGEMADGSHRIGRGRAAPAPSNIGLREQWAAMVPGRRRAVIAAFVTETAKRILGLASATVIEPRQPFQELGLDSLMAVELRNAIGAAVGQPPPATLLFDYPTSDALADHLLALVTPAASRSVSRGVDDADVAALAELSDAEAEALLLAELGGAEAAS
jgi:acyl transferase domain-containing protein/NADPH:quinone reductase-like Zn-dependent oxidoreductase